MWLNRHRWAGGLQNRDGSASPPQPPIRPATPTSIWASGGARPGAGRRRQGHRSTVDGSPALEVLGHLEAGVAWRLDELNKERPRPFPSIRRARGELARRGLAATVPGQPATRLHWTDGAVHACRQSRPMPPLPARASCPRPGSRGSVWRSARPHRAVRPAICMRSISIMRNEDLPSHSISRYSISAGGRFGSVPAERP